MSEFPQRITYVDDDESMRELIKESLVRFDPDISIVTCSSGKELLQRIRELQPDLILLDLNMPEMSGPDTIAALRAGEDAADVPIIFITGYEEVVMSDEYKALGVIGVLHKPVGPKELPERIGELWQEFGPKPEAEPEVETEGEPESE